jgi:hypothetical protein
MSKGDPLAAEADIPRPSWGFDEAWVFTLVERLMALPFARLETEYEILK